MTHRPPRFNTQDIADVLGICRHTVIKLIKHGHLHLVPMLTTQGTRWRPMPHIDFLSWLLNNHLYACAQNIGWPVPIFLLGLPRETTQVIERYYGDRVHTCDSNFSAGLLLRKVWPAVVVLGSGNGRGAMVETGLAVKHACQWARMLAVDDGLDEWPPFSAVLRGNPEPPDVLQALQAVLGMYELNWQDPTTINSRHQLATHADARA